MAERSCSEQYSVHRTRATAAAQINCKLSLPFCGGSEKIRRLRLWALILADLLSVRWRYKDRQTNKKSFVTLALYRDWSPCCLERELKTRDLVQAQWVSEIKWVSWLQLYIFCVELTVILLRTGPSPYLISIAVLHTITGNIGGSFIIYSLFEMHCPSVKNCKCNCSIAVDRRKSNKALTHQSSPVPDVELEQRNRGGRKYSYKSIIESESSPTRLHHATRRLLS